MRQIGILMSICLLVTWAYADPQSPPKEAAIGQGKTQGETQGKTNQASPQKGQKLETKTHPVQATPNNLGDSIDQPSKPDSASPDADQAGTAIKPVTEGQSSQPKPAQLKGQVPQTKLSNTDESPKNKKIADVSTSEGTAGGSEGEKKKRKNNSGGKSDFIIKIVAALIIIVAVVLVILNNRKKKTGSNQKSTSAHRHRDQSSTAAMPTDTDRSAFWEARFETARAQNIKAYSAYYLINLAKEAKWSFEHQDIIYERFGKHLGLPSIDTEAIIGDEYSHEALEYLLKWLEKRGAETFPSLGLFDNLQTMMKAEAEQEAQVHFAQLKEELGC